MRTHCQKALVALLLLVQLLLLQAASVSHHHEEPADPRPQCLATVPRGAHCHLDVPDQLHDLCALCLLASHWVLAVDHHAASSAGDVAQRDGRSADRVYAGVPISADRCRSPPSLRC
ncbi:MAG: hypothetical protein HY319_06560 [Armatimonadetes bacterium]|nr:hypothetical protein [Armatimonadota bacterium]